jgi:putative hemolysin
MTASDTSEPIPIFSFATGELGPISNWIIRSLERFTGQPRIKRLYLDYVNDGRPDELFWQDAVSRLNITPDVHFEPDAYIPKTGRLLVIANHPYGVVDGLILCSEISKVRPDYKIITHQVLRQAPAVKHQILPIDFSETPAALATNMETRHEAVKQLQDHGALILFPSGGISLAPRIIGTARDAQWKTFAAKLAQIPDTTILPIFFSGQNSLSYMAGRKISQTLGYSLMFREICRMIGQDIKVTIRKPIHSASLKAFKDRNEITNYLRALTYGQDKA